MSSRSCGHRRRLEPALAGAGDGVAHGRRVDVQVARDIALARPGLGAAARRPGRAAPPRRGRRLGAFGARRRDQQRRERVQRRRLGVRDDARALVRDGLGLGGRRRGSARPATPSSRPARGGSCCRPRAGAGAASAGSAAGRGRCCRLARSIAFSARAVRPSSDSRVSGVACVERRDGGAAARRDRWRPRCAPRAANRATPGGEHLLGVVEALRGSRAAAPWRRRPASARAGPARRPRRRASPRPSSTAGSLCPSPQVGRVPVAI